MIREGLEVKEEVRCWCGGTGYFHHTSSQTREDGKKTVIYKCLSGHRIFEEINDPRSKGTKTKKKQTKIKTKASSKETTREDE